MSQEKSKLPLLPAEAFDGYSEKTELTDTRCEHKDTKVISGSELRCSCGAVWIGENIVTLHNLLMQRA